VQVANHALDPRIGMGDLDWQLDRFSCDCDWLATLQDIHSLGLRLKEFCRDQLVNLGPLLLQSQRHANTKHLGVILYNPIMLLAGSQHQTGRRDQI
jgi:hypothetical protein